MILSDVSIRERLERGDLVINPLINPDVQIQPASIDLRLDYRIKVRTTREITLTEQGLEIWPGDFLLGSTLERVEIPSDLVGKVEGRSSVGRQGIVIHLTAGFIDPGFRGQITLEIANLGRHPFRLRAGERICQLALHTMTTPAAIPYGSERGSKYQDQVGATEAKKDLVK